MNPSRRSILGGAVALPALAVATAPAAAAVPAGPDVRWTAMVADYRAKRAAWLVTIDVENERLTAFYEARTALGCEPQQPPAPSGGDVLDRTVRELRDACRTPEHKAAWAAWERDHTIWKGHQVALREQIMAPAEVLRSAAYEAQAAMLNALSTYPVRSLADLAEKIEIVRADYDGENVPQEYLADILADVRRLGGEAN